MGMGLDLPGMDLNESMDPSMSMDDSEEQAPDPQMLGGGDAAGQDDMELAQMEQDLEQGGVKGDGVPSSPLNVTPLSDRVAGIGRPPTKTDQIMGLLSDVAAGALAGSQFKSRLGTALRGGGVSPGLAATLGGFAGIQAGEQNRYQRELRRRTFDQQDFQRQQAMYIAELNQAKFNRTEERLDAQADAVKAHYRFMEQKARIDGKKLLLELKNGTVKVIGNNAWRVFTDGRAPIQITDTESGAKALSINLWFKQADANGLTQKQKMQGALKIVNPYYKTDDEKEEDKKKEDAKKDTPEYRSKTIEADTQAYVDTELAALGGNYKNARYRIYNKGAQGLLPKGVSATVADKIISALEKDEKTIKGTPNKVREKTFADLRADAKDAQEMRNIHAAEFFVNKFKNARTALKFLGQQDLTAFGWPVQLPEIGKIMKALIVAGDDGDDTNPDNLGNATPPTTPAVPPKVIMVPQQGQKFSDSHNLFPELNK